MTKRLLYLTALLCVIVLPLRGSPPIGAIVQGSHYDPAKQIVTFDLLNTSHKDITAYSLLVRGTYADGTAGTWEYGGDFLPHIAQTGNGALAPGASIAVEVPLGQQQFQSVTATVDLVVYADDTANVLSQLAFNVIVAQRKGAVFAYNKANELLQNALADPNNAHPSVTVVAQLRALAKQYGTNPPNGVDAAAALLDAATNIANAPKLSRENEDAYLKALIKHHQDRVTVISAHTELRKEVQP